MKCENCRFFKTGTRSDDFGICRRYAPRPLNPTVTPDYDTRWPAVCCDDWCGEFQPVVTNPQGLSREQIAATFGLTVNEMYDLWNDLASKEVAAEKGPSK